LRAVVEAFPDYRWDLQRLLVDGDWLAARLYGVGTHIAPFRGIAAPGRVIHTQELVIYRVADGRIAECWGDLGSTVRDELVSGVTPTCSYGRRMANRYEYTVVELRERMIGGKMSGDKLQKVLNEHAAQGWQLKAITSVEVRGRVGPGAVEGLLVTFERPVG
jgi:Domain of unknown function (DUF4177)/SnoaL-like polyketide cyclase